MADLHLQLRPGTNVPLLNSLASAIVEGGFVDTRVHRCARRGLGRHSRGSSPRTPDDGPR